ncbi:hypothetical protein FTX61_06275 [Nitriliruptoraceae bacterium ZYF776]|nr:hypothetical protein [Profundirhabdus halotolerans]
MPRDARVEKLLPEDPPTTTARAGTMADPTTRPGSASRPVVRETAGGSGFRRSGRPAARSYGQGRTATPEPQT